MKKWMMILLLAGLTATSVSAAWNEAEDEKKPRERMRERFDERREEDRPHFSPEQMEKMKAQRDAVMKLGEAARAETDPVKKDELIAQLKTELNKVADKMHAMHQKGIERAEKDLERLRKRMSQAEENREQMIEDQLQRILSGQKPEPPRRMHKEGERPFGPPPVAD